jgi:hypothetical protein
VSGDNICDIESSTKSRGALTQGSTHVYLDDDRLEEELLSCTLPIFNPVSLLRVSMRRDLQFLYTDHGNSRP